MMLPSDQWPRRHLIDVDQYYRMAEVGLLAPDARVELIEGVIIDMAPIGINHAGVVRFLIQTFDRAVVGDRAVLSVQLPLRLGRRSEPQPDVLLLQPRADLYRTAHPTAADVLLLIEVSDSTLRFDLHEKAALYARHGVTEVWVVDLPNRQLHCMRAPVDGSYRSITVYSPADSVEIAALAGVRLESAALFG